MPYFLSSTNEGLITADSKGDGYTINLKWNKAYPELRTNKIAYNIYMSTDPGPEFPDDFFNVSPTFVSIDGSTIVDIVDLVPGQMYHFAIRAVEYVPLSFDFNTLPNGFNGLKVYPQSLLASDIIASSSIVPLTNIDHFPNTGTIRIGAELINYSSISGNNLLLTNVSLQRGFNDTLASIHNVDGYDGYIFWDPTVLLWPVISEEQNTRVYECWSRFDVGHFPFTMADGYHQRIKDILRTDLGASDAFNVGFTPYDFSGYHRTSPLGLLTGVCIGSYFGGEFGCVDGYGIPNMVRGISAQVQSNQRQEVLLNTIGQPCVLLKRTWTGITCDCMLPYSEYPEFRCVRCLGSGFVVGWTQFFHPRRSDGRIMVRIDPTPDDLLATDTGLESDFKPTAWTLVEPAVYDRDIIIRYDQNDNEEFRYEVMNVTRNVLLDNLMGAQRFALQRIRKTDPAYQIPVVSNTATMPRIITTSIASQLGIPPHSHTLVANESIVSIFQINELTSIESGHNHVVRNGVVLDQNSSGSHLGHVHFITL